MDCRNVREEAIVRSQLNPAIQQHIEGCDECRAFCADISTIQSAFDVPAVTPVQLRERTLAECADLLRDKTSIDRTPWWQKWRRAFDSPRFVTAAAVLCVAILITVTALQIGDAQTDAVRVSLKLAIFQIVAINVFTAIFLPALLLFRGGLGGLATRAMRTGE
jgi:anti-sigma factor RsiW